MNVNVDWCMGILKLKRPMSQSKTRRAYLKLARVYHPDKRSGSTLQFQKLESAYSQLKGRDEMGCTEPPPFPPDIPTTADAHTDSHGVRYTCGSDSDGEDESSGDSGGDTRCQSDDCDWNWTWRYV